MSNKRILPSKSLRPSRLKLSLGAIVCACLALGAVAAGESRRAAIAVSTGGEATKPESGATRQQPGAPAEVAGTAAPAQGRGDKEQFEAESITLYPEGFYPARIVRPAGRFLLAVDNLSDLEEVTLLIERENAGRHRETKLPRRMPRLREIEDLPPGDYTLTVVERPEWSCSITITPR